MMTQSYTQFAATYSCGAYGSGNFDSNTTCATSISGGTLPATGTNIVYGLVGGVLLIVIAIALLISSRRKKRR